MYAVLPTGTDLRDGGHVVVHIGGQSYAANCLLLYLKLGNLHRGGKLRRFDGPAPIHIDSDSTIDLEIALLNGMDLLDAQVRGMELGFIRFGLGMENDIGLRGPSRDFEQQVGVDGLAVALKFDIQRLDRLV